MKLLHRSTKNKETSRKKIRTENVKRTCLWLIKLINEICYECSEHTIVKYQPKLIIELKENESVSEEKKRTLFCYFVSSCTSGIYAW